jgi:SAM-dependent methyltransferase
MARSGTAAGARGRFLTQKIQPIAILQTPVKTQVILTMKEFWDNRYQQGAYAYGEAPNQFFEAQIWRLTPGKLLLPAEGEGRNGVFAAQLGWQVSAFDLSQEGRNKALALAAKHNVVLHYQVGGFSEIDYAPETFDAIALVYAHFPAALKSGYHQKLAGYLKQGGLVIFEAFSKQHLRYNSVNPQVGGPKDEAMLFSLAEVEEDFKGFDFLLLQEEVVELNEGLYHNGTGSVIRFVAQKP